MSGLYTDWGAVFVTETANSSSAVIGTILSESAIILVNLTGNIGGYDQYGKLNYGKAAYSWSAIQPTLNASLNVALAPPVNLAGNFGPVVTFAGNLTVISTFSLSGNLAPIVTFSGALSVTLPLVLAGSFVPIVTFAGNLTLSVVALSGNLAPQMTLGGLLAADLPFAGNLTPNVEFAASELLSGPLWAESAPCPPPMWAESAPCLDPGWVKVPVLSDQMYKGSAYGSGGYGVSLYGQGNWVSTPWAPAELCHG